MVNNKSKLMLAGGAVIVPAAWWLWQKFEKRMLERKPFEEIPSPPMQHWFLGHYDLFFEVLQKNSSYDIPKFANKYGQVGVFAGPARLLMICRLEDARTILSSEYYRSTSWMISRHTFRCFGTKNVALLSGKGWKVQRSAIYKAITPAAFLNASKLAMAEVAEGLVGAIKRRIKSEDATFTTLNIEQIMKMVTIDVFAKTTLSVDLKCCEQLEPSPIHIAFKELLWDLNLRMTFLLNPFNLFYWIPTARNRRNHYNRKLLRGFLARMIKERSEEDKETRATKKDILQFLMDAHAGDEDLLSNETLNDTLLGLLHAGYDSTSIALTFALYVISQHPEVERLLLEEIELVMADDSFDPANLIYCRAVMTEILRLHPPGDINNRVLQKPIQLQGGFVAPAGTRVFVMVDYIQRSERHFENANAFLPERWATRAENGRDWILRTDVDRGNFLAFSAGARVCPGRHFAMQEATVVLAILLKKLRFEALPGYQLEKKRTIVVKRASDGIPMRVFVRE